MHDATPYAHLIGPVVKLDGAEDLLSTVTLCINHLLPIQVKLSVQYRLSPRRTPFYSDSARHSHSSAVPN